MAVYSQQIERMSIAYQSDRRHARKFENIPTQVLARGKILSQWVKVQRVGVISSFRFRILPEMSPSSRLVAFFIGNDGEVVADSTLLEIDDGLPNKASYAPSFLHFLCKFVFPFF